MEASLLDLGWGGLGYSQILSVCGEGEEFPILKGSWSHGEAVPQSSFHVDRWKGENVSTREVEGVLNLVDFLQEVNVYGVPVPGKESGPHFTPAVVLLVGKITAQKVLKQGWLLTKEQS